VKSATGPSITPLLDLSRVDPQRVARDEVVGHEVHRVDGRAALDAEEDVEPEPLGAAELPEARAPTHGLEVDHLDVHRHPTRRGELDRADCGSIGLSHFHHDMPQRDRALRCWQSYGDHGKHPHAEPGTP
jgi:hypothetical protein